MKKFLSIFSVLFVLSVLAPSAFAVTFDVAENVVITENLLDDAYVVSGNASVDADIFGDLYILGGTVSVNGNVNEDLVVIGGRVTVTGNVLGDFRVAGGQVAIYGNVGDDLVIAGGQVDVGKTTIVTGSLVVGAGILTMNGEVMEDVRGGVGAFMLNGKVNGDVVVTVEDTFDISKTSKIGGDLEYSSFSEANIPKDVVSGSVAFNRFERGSVLKDVTYISLINKIISYLSSLILVLVFVLLMPKALVRTSEIVRTEFLKSFGIGFLTIFLALICSIFLMITVFGLSLGLIALATLFVFFFISKVFVAAWFGSYIVNYGKKLTKLKMFLAMSLAMFIYYLVSIIPFIGWFIAVFMFFVGVGALVILKKELFYFLRSKKLV